MTNPHNPNPHQSPENTPADPYLWDRRGTPDPAVAELEGKLGTQRFRSRELAQPRSPGRAVALAAAVVLLACATVWYTQSRPRPSWEVVPLSGTPSIDSNALTNTSRLARNDWLETDATSRASLTVANIGSVTVEPGSRVRLVESNDRHHRMQLAKGAISAFINAPPRLFFVDTPSAQAIDMGCIYTLSVADDGSSKLKTTFGLVELAGKVNGKEVVSKVPSGAVCRTDLKQGPGTPRFEDAPEEFVRALDAFDARAAAGAETATIVESITASAREQDTLSLWHLLARTEGKSRAEVFEKMIAFAGRPADDAAILAADAKALEAWWDRLKLTW